MIPLLGSLGFGFRLIIPKGLPSFVQHSFRFYGLIQDTHVFGLCEGGEIEVQMFMLAQMLIRIPMLKFSTNAPLLQNPCYV